MAECVPFRRALCRLRQGFQLLKVPLQVRVGPPQGHLGQGSLRRKGTHRIDAGMLEIELGDGLHHVGDFLVILVGLVAEVGMDGGFKDGFGDFGDQVGVKRERGVLQRMGFDIVVNFGHDVPVQRVNVVVVHPHGDGRGGFRLHVRGCLCVVP